MQDQMAAFMAYRKPLSIGRMQGIDSNDWRAVFDVDHTRNLAIKGWRIKSGLRGVWQFVQPAQEVV